MTTRIKLRRDTAQNWTDSNPILANGEPGLESDTNQFKFGDGVTVWNSLGYANANGGSKQSRWVSVLNTCGNGQYTIQSSDGLSWTAPTTIENNQYEYIWGLSIGPNSIVYVGDNPGGTYIKWAKNPSEQPHEIEPVEINESPSGQSVDFRYVGYIGGYFIAYGSYAETQVVTSPNITMPYWIYSEDGQNWNLGGVNLIELETIIDTKIGNDSNTYGMRITDVTFNGTGWLFSCEWDYNGQSPGDAGGFYLTNITGTLNSASRGTDIPTAESAHWDGIKWWTYIWDNEDDTYYTNSSTNPTLGTWTQHAISAIAGAKFGIRDAYQYSVEYISQGSVDGVDYLFMGIDDGRMLVTADKGTTWTGVIPNIRRDTLTEIDGGPYVFVDFSNYNPVYIGDKLTISGSSVSAMNGTFYVGISESNGTYWPLFSDISLSIPVSITDWTIDNVQVFASGVYGSYKLDVSVIDGTIADLRVGMICDYNDGKIVAINGNILTMDVPNWNGLSETTMQFKACVEHSFGDYIQYHQVGGEEVLVQVDGNDGQKWAVAHADPRTQANWSWRWSSNFSQAVPFFWINDFEYGSLNPVASSWTYQNPEYKDAINEMVLTDRFTLSLTGGGQYDPPASTTLFMDPNIYSWSLSATSGYYGSDDLGSISSWNNNDVRMSINNHALSLNSDGGVSFPYFNFPNNDGSANQILKTDGNGQLSWVGNGDVTASESPNTRTGTANTLTIGSGNTQSAITGPMAPSDTFTAPRLVIAGRDSYFDGNTSSYLGEGGDLYLWAGKGDNGGDIKIDAGDSLGINQEGGTIKIRAGHNNNTGGLGGFVHIESGYGSPTNGIVRITTPGNNWDFNADGSLTAPGAIKSTGVVIGSQFILSVDGVNTTGVVRLADTNSKVEFYAPSGFNFNSSSRDIFGGIWNYSWNAVTRTALTVNDMIAPATAGKNIAIASTAPTHYYGSSGDKKGMVAFDSGFIYYCTDTFTPGTQTASIDGAMDIVSGTPFNLQVGWGGVDITGWTLTIPDYTASLVTAWIDNGGGSITVTVDGNYSGVGNFTLTFTQPDASVTTPIWKRLAWSSDTW